jgi:Uma2 family endonuclease
MTPPTKPRATYEDLVAVPENLLAEIIEGELYTSPRPAPRHAKANTALGAALHGSFDAGRGGPGGWTILFEPELHLAGDVVVPDLAGWRRVRMPRLPETAYFPLAPDWICEVVSPSTVALDPLRKLAIYAREAVQHAWLVDPIARTVEVHRLEADRWVIAGTFGAADTVHAEPFDAVALDLTLLWEDAAPGD